MPKISVIMPVYKAEEFLPKAIESILSQSFTDFELLAVNDFEDDEAAKTIKSYSQKDPRVRFVINTGKRMVGALNTGLQKAKGEYIARMDSDDFSFPQRFEKQIKFMDAHPEIGLCGSYMSTFGDKEMDLWYPFPTEHDYIKVAMLFFTPVAHPTVMIRKGALDKDGLKYDSDRTCGEDYDLWSKAINHFKFANLKDILLSYRLHANNAHASRADEHRALQTMVLKRLLKNTNIDPSENEVALHFRLYWGPYDQTEEFIKTTEIWFKKIIKANKAHKYFNNRALKKTLQKVFWKVCKGSLPRKKRVLRFLKSSLGFYI